MLLIVFGAGASHGHAVKSTEVDNHAKLPLTNDLINTDLGYVREAMTRWRGAVPLLNRLNKLKADGNTRFDLENSLYIELRRSNKDVQAQLLSFSFYIHDIIRTSETNVRSFNQGNTNYTVLLNRLQEGNFDSKSGIILVTFNYDTLLETACNQVYPVWEFNDYDDYFKGSPTVRLYKPHGSLNWRRKHKIPRISNKLGLIKVLLEPKKYGITRNHDEIVDYNSGYGASVTGTSLSEPILALPYKEKTNFVFPDEHKVELIKDMSKVTHVLTIGWRGEEKHFQKNIMSKVPKGKKVKVLNINNGGTDIINNLNNSLGEKIADMGNFNKGFGEFLEDKLLLETFLIK